MIPLPTTRCRTYSCTQISNHMFPRLSFFHQIAFDCSHLFVVQPSTAGSVMSKRGATSSNGGDCKTPTKRVKGKSNSVESILEPGWFEKNSSKIFVGAHVSAAGGPANAVNEAASIGAKAFALFLCNQRTWNVKPLDEETAQAFRDSCLQHGYPSHLILPHASYLLNCGSSDKELLSKSRSLLLDGVKRCEKLNIDLYNFHPGSSCGKIEASESCKLIAESINWIHSLTSKTTLREFFDTSGFWYFRFLVLTVFDISGF